MHYKLRQTLLYTALLWAILGNIAAPRNAHSGDSKYAGSFLDLGIGARALAIGGAFVAVADNGSAFYWNPAGLSLLRRLEINFMHTAAFGSITNPLADYNHLGISLPLRGEACLSFNYVRFSVDDIPIYPELSGENLGQRLRNPDLRPSGEALGFFSDKEEAFFFSFAKMNRVNISLGWQYLAFPVEIPVGMNFKVLRQNVHNYSASGFGVDLGMMLRFGVDDLFDDERLGKFAFGVAVMDVSGTTLSWNTQHKDPIKMKINLGVSYLQPLPLWDSTLLLSASWDRKWQKRKHLGLEYQLRGIFVRAGLDEDDLSFGAGFQFWLLRLSYAYVGRELGNVHRLSGALLLAL